MDFDPARSARDILTMIFSSPSLHKADPDGAHFNELEHSLVSLGHRARQELRKYLVVEYLQTAVRRNLAHSGGQESVNIVAVSALDEDATL